MFTLLCLPKKIVDSSFSLRELGINNVAWDYKHIFEVIEYLTQQNYVILGGDVYRIKEDTIEITSDSWYTDDTSSYEEASIEVAQARTTEYINKYHLRNGNQYLYSLVCRKV